MTTAPAPLADPRLKARNRRVALLAGAIAASMVGAAYAAVPLYRLFCQVTGFGGTTQRADAPADTVLERDVTVQFDANVNPGLAWDFRPAQRQVTVKVGEQALAFYRVTNRSDRPLTGTATFNVTPDKVGLYFNKIECFCFTEQTLEPGQSVDMPVVFFVDPAIDADIDLDQLKTLTLSYTFYPSPAAVRTSQSAPADVN